MSRIGKDGRIVPPNTNESSPSTTVAKGKGPETKGSTGVEEADGHQRVSAADAERLISQAGFVRSGAKRKGPGAEAFDNSQAPIPLPQDDVDSAQWSFEGLDAAQASLVHHGAMLKRGSKNKMVQLMEMWQAVVEAASEDKDEQDQQQRLEALTEEIPPDAEAMRAVAGSVHSHFGIDLTTTPAGPALMATSLLVAGEAASVGHQPGSQELDAERLARGAQQIVDSGRRAVDDARRMNQGVTKNLAMQRTFVAKKR